MSRLDALMVREYTTRDGEKKPAFTKIGAAFPLKSGTGYQVVLDAFPAPVDGQYKILLKEPQEKRSDPESFGRTENGKPAVGNDFDEAPF